MKNRRTTKASQGGNRASRSHNRQRPPAVLPVGPENAPNPTTLEQGALNKIPDSDEAVGGKAERVEEEVPRSKESVAHLEEQIARLEEKVKRLEEGAAAHL